MWGYATRLCMGAVVVLATMGVVGTVVVVAMAPPASAQSAPLPAVVVAMAEMTAAEREAVLTGRVVALQRVELRARVSGFLESKNFNEGDRVEEGQTLFTIEDGAYAAAVQEIEGAIAAAQAAFDLAAIEEERQETLVARGTTAQRSLDIAQAEVGRSAGEIVRLTGSLQRAELDLSYTQIIAPFEGVVGLTDWDVGAFVGPEAGALVTLVRTDPMTVEFPIASADVFRLSGSADETSTEEGLLVQVRLPDDTLYDHPGRIDFVDVEVNPGTDTIVLRAVFPNPDGELVHGSLVRIVISDQRTPSALTIPQQAIQQDMQGAFVMIVDEASKAQIRRVTVDRYSRGRAVIESGLEEGEVVIVEGVNKARPGAEVDAARAEEASAEAADRSESE